MSRPFLLLFLWCYLALGLPLAAPASAAETLTSISLEQAQTQAQKRKTALVVYLGTVWCGPCKLLQEQVLPQRDVKEALRGVVFAHYDAEVGVGVAAARTLNVHGYPTLLALAQDGTELGRITGVPSPAEFSQWLIRAAQESPATRDLEAQVKRDPQSARALLTLARRYRKAGDIPQALALFERAATAAGHSSADQTIAASADYDRRIIALNQELKTLPQKSLIDHLTRFPSGPTADRALSALSRVARVGPTNPALGAVFNTYLDANSKPGHEESLNQAVYSFLRAGASEQAERAANILLQREASPMYLDTLAEVFHLRGDTTEALRLSAQAISALGNKDESLRGALLRNQARFKRGKKEPPAELLPDDEPLPWERP